MPVIPLKVKTGFLLMRLMDVGIIWKATIFQTIPLMWECNIRYFWGVHYIPLRMTLGIWSLCGLIFSLSLVRIFASVILEICWNTTFMQGTVWTSKYVSKIMATICFSCLLNVLFYDILDRA